MSLLTLNEAKKSKVGFDIEGIVKCMNVAKYINKRNGNVELVCNAQLFDGVGNFISISLWNNDIKKVRNNLKIKIINAYTKIFQGKPVIYVSENGTIDVLGFNPNLIKEDIINIKKRKKIISFKEYQRHVENSSGPIYLGKDKNEYLVITKAFTRIEKLASRFRNRAVSSAIAYLYNKVTLSAEQICTILKIFNISISCDRILRNSISSKLKQNTYDENSYKITVKKTDSNSIHLETTFEENIEGPTNTALPSEIWVDEVPQCTTNISGSISSDSKFTPIMIEDMKYVGNLEVHGEN